MTVKASPSNTENAAPQASLNTNGKGTTNLDKYPWPLWQRLIMISTAYFVSVMMSGVTVGHMAFRELIYNHKDYLCKYEFMMKRETECYQNELRLHGVFFISSIVVKFSGYPVGLALDRYGPRLTSMFGCLIFAGGTIMLALSNLQFDRLHYFGYTTLAVGGVFLYLPSLQLCRMLPKLSSFLMALMTSAFDISAIVFYLINKVAIRFQHRFSINWLLGGYTIIPLFSLILVTLFYPNGKISTVPRKPRGDGFDTAAAQQQQQGYYAYHQTLKNSEKERASSSTKWTIKQIAGSFDFWIVAIFTGIMTSRFSHFLATFHPTMARSTLSWKFQKNTINGFVTLFPLGGLISISAIGQLLQSFSLAINTTIIWIAIVCVWGSIDESMSKDMVGASIILCAILRPYYYSITNQLCERLFGQAHHGKVYGLVLAVAAIVNMLVFPSIYDGYFGYAGVAELGWNTVKFCSKLGFLLPLYLFLRKL